MVPRGWPRELPSRSATEPQTERERAKMRRAVAVRIKEGMRKPPQSLVARDAESLAGLQAILPEYGSPPSGFS
ncbi:hypothetical protein NDU88_005585 [Pleurodeles waltl]|uniref:Uncharacterized protein n=1 Tax=Pleurodeles waltl TaxID=8319 RepID=A0AAV7VM65_PLEWA|nr:hypothetical protein NDU88_005585 [Pleurodeles waltl]